MLDALTNFGLIEIKTGETSTSKNVKSDIVDMRSDARLEAGPDKLRFVVYPEAVPSGSITVSLLEADTVNEDALTSPVTVGSWTYAADEVKTGVPLKVAFPLKHKRFLQAQVVTSGTVKVFAGLEFGA